MDDATVAQAVAFAAHDGEFSLFAGGWTGSILLRCGDSRWVVPIASGRLGTPQAIDTLAALGADDVAIEGEPEHWTKLLASVPPPPFVDCFGAEYAGMHVGVGTPLDERRHGTVRRLCELLRHAENGSDPAPRVLPNENRHGEHDQAVGRYVHLDLDGVDHRVYYEEAGQGIGLLCQHTAGSDGRQWRHLLEDDRVTNHFRVIAYDLPYHGKSIPSPAQPWWAQRYVLTRARAMAVPRRWRRCSGSTGPCSSDPRSAGCSRSISRAITPTTSARSSPVKRR